MPGPSPLYHPVFTVEQVTQAELVARQHQAPHAQVQRAQLALLLHTEPFWDNATLAKRLRQHPLWIRKWRKRWTREDFSLEDKKGRGRKPQFSPTGAQHR